MTAAKPAQRRTGLRYAIAMALALGGALLASQTISPLAAQWVVTGVSFESPDQVSNAEDAAFLGLAAVGLVVGWLVGWALAGLVAK